MAAHKDVIVIGAGLSGLSAGNLLSRLGVDTLVLERAPDTGGGTRSIQDAWGNTFDNGYHTLDHGRSPITTRFFQRVLHGNHRVFPLKRGLVLGDSLFPYNAPLEQWPRELQALFDGPPREDDVGGDLSRERIAAVYGKRFADYAFEEILASYPTFAWGLRNGARPEDHIDYVYPWFFPRARRAARREEETYAYHDKMREVEQEVMYPLKGGFGAFVKAVEADIDARFCQVKTGQKDLRLDFKPGSFQLTGITALGETYTANHYF